MLAILRSFALVDPGGGGVLVAMDLAECSLANEFCASSALERWEPLPRQLHDWRMRCASSALERWEPLRRQLHDWRTRCALSALERWKPLPLRRQRHDWWTRCASGALSTEGRYI